MVKGGFIFPREMNGEIEDINIVDTPEEILKEELTKDINRNTRDTKAFYILSLINKYCDIYNYLNMEFSSINNDDLAYKNILDFYYKKVKDTIFFKGTQYTLYFFYKNISMNLYRENIGKPIYLKHKENGKEFIMDLSFISGFIEENKNFTKKDLYEIKNKLISSLFNMVLKINDYRKKTEYKQQEEERLNKIIKKVLEEEKNEIF